MIVDSGLVCLCPQHHHWCFQGQDTHHLNPVRGARSLFKQPE
jgi:hypothetical protein